METIERPDLDGAPNHRNGYDSWTTDPHAQPVRREEVIIPPELKRYSAIAWEALTRIAQESPDRDIDVIGTHELIVESHRNEIEKRRRRGKL